MQILRSHGLKEWAGLEKGFRVSVGRERYVAVRTGVRGCVCACACVWRRRGGGANEEILVTQGDKKFTTFKVL